MDDEITEIDFMELWKMPKVTPLPDVSVFATAVQGDFGLSAQEAFEALHYIGRETIREILQITARGGID